MHVDREREATEADKRYAEFLFAQSSPPTQDDSEFGDDISKLAEVVRALM
jgi:hypothetical protein